MGRYVTAAFVNGGFQVFYYDASTGNLRHAWTSTAGWNFETLDGDSQSVSHYNADVGRYAQVVAQGTDLVVFAYDATLGNLRHTWLTSTGWKFEQLDGDSGSISHYPSDVW